MGKSYHKHCEGEAGYTRGGMTGRREGEEGGGGGCTFMGQERIKTSG